VQVTAEVLIRYSLPSVTDSESPVAMKSGMAEVFFSERRLVINIASIIDVAFIVPLQEVGGRSFHLAGARNTYIYDTNYVMMVCFIYTLTLCFCRELWTYSHFDFLEA
jgi:hypothetical protein